jgi:hypothetical protein
MRNTAVDEQIRQALRDYERREDITASEHAELLGVSKMTMSDFLRGNKRMGVALARAIKARHPDLLHLLLRWLDEPARRPGPDMEEETAAAGPPSR